MIYLAEKYGKDDSLYPKLPKVRAVVNQRLYFDMGVMYDKFSKYFTSKYMRKEPEDPELFKGLESALELLNTFLEGNEYAACDHLTLADLALVASVSTYEIMGVDFTKFPNVARWFEKCKSTVPGYEVNQEGIDMFKQYLMSG